MKAVEPTVGELPRERFLSLGPSALTVPELLAILLGTGTAHSDAACVARSLMDSAGGSLRSLARRPVGFLARVPGIGKVKAVRVGAALELARRLAAEGRHIGVAIGSPADVQAYCGPRLRDLTVEEFHVLTLDAQNRVTRQVLITRGILNGSLVHPREVFRAAIAEAAAGIIVVHNHPSGHPVPSAEDRAVTLQLVEAGKLLRSRCLTTSSSPVIGTSVSRRVACCDVAGCCGGALRSRGGTTGTSCQAGRVPGVAGPGRGRSPSPPPTRGTGMICLSWCSRPPRVFSNGRRGRFPRG